MPVSGSYHYPVMSAPPATVLTRKAETEIATLTSGSAGAIISATDISQWGNVAVTLQNAGAGSLGTVEVQVSPDAASWETLDDTTFSGLAAAAMTSSQLSGNSRKYLRVQSTDTPAGAVVTGSLHLNNG